MKKTVDFAIGQTELFLILIEALVLIWRRMHKNIDFVAHYSL